MRKFELFGKVIARWGEDKSLAKTKTPLPPGRVSVPENRNGSLKILQGGKDVVDPLFNNELIPIIRSLCYTNPDLSQALDNIVQLGNTGHEIEFDESVSEADTNKIKLYLESKKQEWSESTAGMDGLVNKMIAQIMIGGALSGEWVPKMDLSGIDRFVFVNPESVQFVLDKRTQRYIPYQRPTNKAINLIHPEKELIKLNTNTYRYFALNGDTEIPYGIPPYMAALESVNRQRTMQENIDFIVDQIGLMGFLSILVQKPDQGVNEQELAYINRLEADLDRLKARVQSGMKEGIMTGYIDDTEITFSSPTKDASGASELFQANELMLASGLKQDASLLGRSYGTTETQITVIFTKLLSQLTNIQNLAKRNLEFGYELDLRLAGFKFKSLKVEFKESTITDELKYQQALEIKIRNSRGLYYDGINNLDEYAQSMGKEKADQKEPRFIMDSAQDPEQIKADREASKNKSDKKVRDKNRPRPKKIE